MHAMFTRDVQREPGWGLQRLSRGELFGCAGERLYFFFLQSGDIFPQRYQCEHVFAVSCWDVFKHCECDLVYLVQSYEDIY